MSSPRMPFYGSEPMASARGAGPGLNANAQENGGERKRARYAPRRSYRFSKEGGIVSASTSEPAGSVLAAPCILAEPPRQAHLAAVIEGEIIPRLMLIHSKHTQVPTATARVDVHMIADFAERVQHANHQELLGYVRDLMEHRGITLHEIFMQLFTGSARRLGELWTNDDIDFVAVTIGLSHLQELLHELAPVHDTSSVMVGRNALIVPTPGDQHTFGSMIVIQLFREAGWEVNGGVMYSVEELEQLVRRQNFALVGFSLASEHLISHLAHVIACVRKASRTPDLAVVVGGHVSTLRPDLALAVGADYSVTDPMLALEFGGTWFDNARNRPC